MKGVVNYDEKTKHFSAFMEKSKTLFKNVEKSLSVYILQKENDRGESRMDKEILRFI